MSRIHLEIDRLVLNGFQPREANALADALQAQLSRALADPRARRELTRSHRTPVLKLGSMTRETGAAGAGKLGTRIAQAVGKGLKP